MLIKTFRSLPILLAILLAILPLVTTQVQGEELVISGNGTNSEGQVLLESSRVTTVEQNNQANVGNDLNTSSTTGNNAASSNTNSDTTISTGDASQSLTLTNSVNNSELEISSCCDPGTEAQISGNGSGSQNQIELSRYNEVNISINQIANIKNDIKGSANTGENSANDNTGGDVSITTGNITVSGGIVNGPINIANVSGGVGGASAETSISSNGDGSSNLIFLALNNLANISVNHSAYVNNNVYWDLTTGGNQANRNTGGNVWIGSGDILFDFFIKNGPINFSFVDVSCCDPFDPKDPEDHDNGGVVSPPGDQNNDEGEDEGEEEPHGKLLPSAAAIEAGGPGIAGLSDTSSGEAQAIFFWVGLAMLAYGSNLIGRELLGKISPSVNKR